jgi:hypothetical protein
MIINSAATDERKYVHVHFAVPTCNVIMRSNESCVPKREEKLTYPLHMNSLEGI